MSDRYLYFAHQGRTPQEPRIATPCKIGITRHLGKRMVRLNCRPYFAVCCELRFAQVLERRLHWQFYEQGFDNVAWGPEGHTEWFWIDARMRALILYVRGTGSWPWDHGAPVVIP